MLSKIGPYLLILILAAVGWFMIPKQQVQDPYVLLKLAEIDKKIAATQAVQTIEKHYYKTEVVRRDQDLEQQYKEGKVSADTVIKSKNHRIAKVETLLARCDTLRGQDSLKIATLEKAIFPKNKYYVTGSAGLDNLSAGGLVVTKKGYIFGAEKSLIDPKGFQVRIGIQIK